MPMAERVYGDAVATREDRNAGTLARWQFAPAAQTVRSVLYVRADVLSNDWQGPAGLSTVKEEHQAHGRKSSTR